MGDCPVLCWQYRHFDYCQHQPDRIIARTTRLALESLMASDPISVFELVSLCRDPQHQLRGDTRQKLEAMALVNANGQIHDATRKAVLAEVVGDGLEMRLI